MSDHLLKVEFLHSKVKLWRTLTFLMAFILLILSNYVDFLSISNFLGNEYIAKLSINGTIETDDELNKILKKIAKNDHIKGLILNINSPGGTITGSEVLYQNIRNISQYKPVIALLSDFATSGGYMAAVAADYIISRNTSVVGSIGVLLQYFGVTSLAEKIGISLKSIKSSNLKNAASPFEELTQEKEDSLRRLINESYKYFIDIVAERRKMEKDQVLKLADGSIYTGLEALSNGLVDQIGGEDEAMQWFDSQNIKTKKIKDLSKNRTDKSIIKTLGLVISNIAHYYIK